ncbi:FAD-binding oxidoreductase [Litoreibacter roseus]|uniref:D-2-hydroxyacid dehydrogenase n=1 Tax=Litoreibacter roseus TaxID=2601869 RepID=A0A6N6JGF3_9RHOB|nr:FAD-binding oxidoreductase [Litoreibacter roseus]GFE65306.1 D-2-hydroxyacid dehydrogenase [Litoreibacter roseus]
MLNSVTDDFRQHLRSLLPDAAFRELTDAYLKEPRGRYAAGDGFLVAPDSVDQVSRIMRACSNGRVSVVPYGGGTGLVGGQIASKNVTPVILSLERMTRIRDISPIDNVAVVEAGAILQSVQEAAQDADRLFPLSLASEGSARIGGLLATNAGGVNTLRYGNARDLCLGLEVVLADGTIVNGLSRLRKNNTGYDLRHLMIGAEGSLGIITAASLKLFPQPAGSATAMMVVKDPQAALGLLALAGSRLGGQISAFELISRVGLDFLAEVGPDIKTPFAETPEWMVLLDVGTFAGVDPETALEDLFVKASEDGMVSDGVIAQSEGQRAEFWAIRESIPEANRRIGSVSSHDISVPIARIPDFIDEAPGRLAMIGQFRINCFGHMGDGNLHYNVFPMPGKSREDHQSDRAEIKRVVHDLTHEMEGSISAEHGIGRLKVDDLITYGDPGKLAAMRLIKDALDPLGILNPGAVLAQPDH